VPPCVESGNDTVLDTDFDHALAADIVTSIDTSAVVELPQWQYGLAGTSRTTGIGDNSGILTIIAGVAILMLLSYGKFRRLFSSMTSNLWSLRTRANAFDDHTTNETPVLILLAAQWSLYTGLLLYSAVAPDAPRSPTQIFCSAMSIAGLMAAYYILQIIIYFILGYTFTSPRRKVMLIAGFTSSQSLLGFVLMPAALVAIFYTEAGHAMRILGLTAYILARIVFNIKGFRIFYQNFSSLLYYILYLCTLEIIPPVTLYNLAKIIAA